MDIIILLLPLLVGWLLDVIFGDPARLPHPIVYFGRAISFLEHKLNNGAHRTLKGGVVAVGLIAVTYALSWWLLGLLSPWLWVRILVEAVLIFYCLAGTTLIREVRMVFEAADRSLDEGRRQVARIVGRDTAALTDHEVRTAAFETLAENLSDGVIAPLFWYALLDVPGMLAYKMVNTLDSMIGYRSERYRMFGTVAARIDDAANWLPARITALLMVIAAVRPGLIGFVRCFGPRHASPNSGYPEAALAGVLDCRFGGPHDYFGETVYKPYIGSNERLLTSEDMRVATRINRVAEFMAVALAAIVRCAILI
ncbi:adenosylcobinamide-phosphate synthase CbiB [uncultured Muribaculum sp.]|jgi:adenosylcobinamide-phosphate synthase|uniref:adenosylcobinamide-phosphate synthase CbiB n=1 Tax=uncultured Muribaculum sp. TaxID=1918613 RepID=UPI000B017F80|nr:adenosylcobinamide-phosphate synthase CbiB [uncultured Muribaculum sp.]